MQLYDSLTLTYSRSSALIPLVGQSTNCLNVGCVAARVMWLKSPEIAMNTLGCSVCSLAVSEWMTTVARDTLVDGGALKTSTTV